MKIFSFKTTSICDIEAETEEEARKIFDADHCHCDVEEEEVNEVFYWTGSPK